MTKTYWTFEFDDEIHDCECETKKEAEQAADVWWNERHEDESWNNGDTVEDTGFIISFNYDDDGERVNVKRTEHALYFEYYHGDYAEHFNQGDYL